QGAGFVVLLGWLYHSILYSMVLQWGKDPNFQHCYFVPAFSFYVLWQDRQRLRSIQIKPAWSGLIFVAAALFLLILATLGIEIFTQRVSSLILLGGLIVLFCGWEFFRAVFFPWAFLFLMVPLPKLILQEFTFPLQIFASKIATAMLRIVNVPVFREGNRL